MARPDPPSTHFGDTGLVSHELHFRVMNTDAQVIVVGAEGDLAIWAADRAAALEACWTRFAPSELGALAARCGEEVTVSADTFRLIEASCTAWRATGGAFDPSVRVQALGYDRTFDELEAIEAAASDRAIEATAAPGLAGVALDAERSTVRLPAGVTIDPGGIGKGLAADLIVDELLERGALGALVNLGGDCRVEGEPAESAGWGFGVEDPFDPDQDLARIRLDSGGIATSSTRRRRWRAGGVELHHLVNPATGLPADTGVRSATAVAGNGWWAEAEAKMLVVRGAAGLDELEAASAIVVLDDGSVQATEDLAAAILAR